MTSLCLPPVDLLQLLRLVSPALPIGGFAYSRGLEHAVEAGWVRDEAMVESWVFGQLEHAVSRLDVPVLVRCWRAWADGDRERVRDWSAWVLASREGAELLAEERALGAAMARLLVDLGVHEAAPWVNGAGRSLCAVYALACVHWKIAMHAAALGYAWIWVESQVAAAVKLVPLGQTAGQRLLVQAAERIPPAVELGLALPDDSLGAASPGLGIASARHETQYTRLFRS